MISSIVLAARKDANFVSDVFLMSNDGTADFLFDSDLLAQGIAGATYIGWMTGTYGPKKAKQMYEKIIED